jgi:hypothetical protein
MPEPLDNPLRYSPHPVMGPDEGRAPALRPALGNLRRPDYITPELLDAIVKRFTDAQQTPDSMAIMHVLEQIKNEMRTLISEVSTMAMELANVRRNQQPGPRRF